MNGANGYPSSSRRFLSTRATTNMLPKNSKRSSRSVLRIAKPFKSMHKSWRNLAAVRIFLDNSNGGLRSMGTIKF